MPPVIAFVLGAIGAALLARFLVREVRRINAELHPGPAESTDDRGRKLERDPVTGVYRPK